MITPSFPKVKRVEDKKLLQETKKHKCAVCGKPPGDSVNPIDPHHIRTVKSGGPDEDFNLWPLCRIHHTQWHKVGGWTFLRLHPAFNSKLVLCGWYWNGYKLCHPALEKGNA